MKMNPVIAWEYVSKMFTVNLYWFGFGGLCWCHRIGEHFPCDQSLRWTPVNITEIKANPFDRRWYARCISNIGYYSRKYTNYWRMNKQIFSQRNRKNGHNSKHHSPSVVSLLNGCRSSTNDRLFLWHNSSACGLHKTPISGENTCWMISLGVSGCDVKWIIAIWRRFDQITKSHSKWWFRQNLHVWKHLTV